MNNKSQKVGMQVIFLNANFAAQLLINLNKNNNEVTITFLYTFLLTDVLFAG